jgi:hypothetical protein
VVAKESQNKGGLKMFPANQVTDNGHGPVLAEASREYGEEETGEDLRT